MADFHVETHACPSCSVETMVRRLVSTDGYVAVDLDYRTYARGADPTRLLLTRCPGCSYTEYVTDFHKPIPSYVAEAIASADFRMLVSSDRASDFPLVAFVKATKAEPSERIAYCYLRASWFSGDLGRDEEETRYLEKASENFERAVASKSLSQPESERTYYLLGELYRRLGRFPEAEERLGHVSGEDFTGLIRDERNLIRVGVRARRRVKNR